MKKVIFALFLVLFLIGCESVPEGNYAVYPLDNQTITPGSTLDVQGRHFILLNKPSPYPTYTMYPTYTALPYYDPIFDSPTPELYPTYPGEPPIPTSKPTATAVTITPVPTGPSGCIAYNANTYNINIRSTYSTTGTVLGAFPPKATAQVGQFYNGFAYIVYNGIYGWVKLGSDLVTTQGDCNKIPTTQPKVMETPSMGFHVLFGGGSPSVVNYANKMQVIKCLTGSESICTEARRLNPNIVTIYRSLNTCRGMIDGPQLDQWNGETWYNCVKSYWPDGYSFYEYVNEIGVPYNDFSLFAKFSIEFATAAAKDGRCTLAFSFAPGNPEISRWSDLYPYLVWANNNPCGKWPDGTLKYHGIALHQAGYLPSSYILRPDSWVNNIWVAGRDILIDNMLYQTKGFSFRDFRGYFAITEGLLSDGYSGSWSDVWACLDQKNAYWTTRNEYEANHPWIDAFTVWAVGTGGSKWTDLSQCLSTIYG